jgi:demethylmenaquinone methyltransferase/2-methoxy-6-polyprenyl-1,4-benzoquinol methylase
MPTTLEPPMTEAAATPVDKSGPRVRRMFGEIAGRYDLLNHLLSLNVDRYWRRRTVRLVPPKAGSRILDVCTGTGDLALAYVRAANHVAEPLQGSDSGASERLHHIVGADFCHEMLDIGRQKALRADVADRITFIEADAQQLPLPNDEFDIVCVAFGLRNVADTDAGLREMARVCAPGGRVAVLEFSTPQWQPFKGVYSWYFRHVLPRIGQLVSRNRESAYSYLPESVGQFPQGEALAARMRTAGLQQVKYHTLTLGVATLYVGVKRGRSADHSEK